jgi:hypothetical protein
MRCQLLLLAALIVELPRRVFSCVNGALCHVRADVLIA